MSQPASDRWVDFRAGAAGVALLFLGCCPPPATAAAATTPAPAKATETADTTAERVAALPPEPECESTLRACKSTDSTRLRILDTLASFHPPTGWNYAKEKEQSVAFSPDRTAMLAFTLAHSNTRDDLVEASKRLSERLHLRSVKYAWLVPRLAQAQLELEAGPHAIALWEVNQSSQFGVSPKLEDELPGTFLLVTVEVEGQGAFVGTAFVTKPQGDEHAASVMESLGTFRVEGEDAAKKETQDEPKK